MPKLIALDFETYYDDAGCSIGAFKGDYEAYCAHPDFDAYLVALSCYNGKAHHPKEAPWYELHGAVVVAHNAAFEAAVFRHLKSKGIIHANIVPAAWHCTATDPLAPKGRRSLADAAALYLGHTVDKTPRAKMSGRRWFDLSDSEKDEMRTYCIEDAYLSLRLANRGVGMRTVTFA